MRIVHKYQTNDGSFFDTADKAKKYEVTKMIEDRFREKFKIAFQTGRAESLLILMLAEPKFIRDSLNELLRKTKGIVEETA